MQQIRKIEDTVHTFISGDTRTTSHYYDNEWFRWTVRYNVGTLQQKALVSTIKSIESFNDIDCLLLPPVLKMLIKEYYLKIKLYCDDTISTLQFENEFIYPFENVGIDGRIFWHNFKGVPEFAYEKNVVRRHVYRLYTTLNKEDLEWVLKYYSSGRCNDCAIKEWNDPKYIMMEYVTEEEVVNGENIADECLNVSSYWCKDCKTAALFTVDDYEVTDYWYTNPFEKVLQRWTR